MLLIGRVTNPPPSVTIIVSSDHVLVFTNQPSHPHIHPPEHNFFPGVSPCSVSVASKLVETELVLGIVFISPLSSATIIKLKHRMFY